MSDIRANELQVYASPLPFSNKRIGHIARCGQSIEDILRDVCPQMPILKLGAVVMIDGYIISRTMWAEYRPAYGSLVNIRIVPQGGGGGGKNPLATLLSIAVLIAAPYAGAFLAQAAFGAGIIGSVGGIIAATPFLTAAVGIIGKLAIAALIPPPKQSNQGIVNNPSESPTLFIEGARNTLDPFGVVPICLGTNRMFPPQAARAYTETAGADQYVRQIFTYGFGDKLQITNIQIGETSIDEFDEVEMEHRLEGNLHVSTSLFSDDVFQEDFSVLLNQADGFSTRSTQNGIDEVVVDITFARGLAQFTSNGQRVGYSVEFELQFAENGVSPQTWSPAAGSYSPFSGTTLTPSSFEPTANKQFDTGFYFAGYRRDIVCLDIYTGALTLLEGVNVADSAALATARTLPSNGKRIATAVVKVRREEGSSIVTKTIDSLSDDRQPTDYGQIFQSSADFVPSVSGSSIVVSGGNISSGSFTVSGSQTEALRIQRNIKFPSNGKYDIRVRRLSSDTSSDQILDKAYLSAIRSITHVAPVNLHGINGTAVRIKGTDQLNGGLDQFNAIVSNIILDYRADTDEWVEAATSNPASIYRYVLQGGANMKALPDEKIDLDAIQEWHAYCELKGYSYNKVIDYETSVDEVLRDVATAGRATPAIVDGRRSVVVDRDKTEIVQIITPRNSWDYRGELTYPDLPHAFRVEFRNASKGYQTDERIVYADGYDANNATLFERLEWTSCTNSNLAFKHGRAYLAAMILRPETHTFMMDVENLVANRGDRIKFVHDIPIIGVGDGRIKSITGGEATPTLSLDGGGTFELEDGSELFFEGDGFGITPVSSFTIDDSIDMETGKTYYVRIRKADGTQLYRQIETDASAHNEFVFAQYLDPDDAPSVGDLCYFVEAGGEADFIISKIEPQDDLTARITCVDYAPEIFDAESIAIPPFNSHVTIPLQLKRPTPPVLVDIQSDESVMLVNSDGSYTPRLVISMTNSNEGDVFPVVQYRVTGTDKFIAANVLQSSPTLLAISGFDDGVRYDIQVRYKRSGSAGTLSLPLSINNYKFVGATGLPHDVENFTINIAGDTAILKWDANTDIDISHYHIKFARVFADASWETAQTLDENVTTTQFITPFQGGTYLIKAVDHLNNESLDASLIVTYDPGVVRNVVETLDQLATSPIFAGDKDNVIKVGSTLQLADVYADGYYYFDRTIDLGTVYNSTLSATVVAGGAYTNNLYEIADLFAEDDVFGYGATNNVFVMDDLFTENDLFGIGTDSWLVELQCRTTQDDTAGSPVNWSAWTKFVTGQFNFRGIEFRALMRSLSPITGITPTIYQLSVVIDMPDRIIAANDLTVTVAGLRVDFVPPFLKFDGIGVTGQGMSSGDYYTITSKDETGFDIAFYDSTDTPVERTIDYVAKGYGINTA